MLTRGDNILDEKNESETEERLKKTRVDSLDEIEKII